MLQKIWLRLPRNRRPAELDKIDDPVVLLESNVYGHPLARSKWDRNLEELRLQIGKTFKFGNACTSIEKTNYFLSVNVDDIKMLGRRESLAPRWARFRKKIEPGDPTSPVNQLSLGCTQRATSRRRDDQVEKRNVSENYSGKCARKSSKKEQQSQYSISFVMF